MAVDEFLEHELADRLTRLGSNYLDCFVIDVGEGHGVDFEAVLKEGVPSAPPRPASRRRATKAASLYETLYDCLEVLAAFKKEGRIRLAGISCENIALLKRILAKESGFDVVFAPYNYCFRAASELVAIASETNTAFVATRPLWWGIREIPVTVLSESPFPRDKASVAADSASLAAAACKWPLSTDSVVGVLADVASADSLAGVSAAVTDSNWTRADEELLRPIASVASAQKGLFLILSAMNSADADTRTRGWAAYVRRGLADFGYDPAGPSSKRVAALARISKDIVSAASPVEKCDLEELL